jgi:hypothetical protein
MTVTGIVLARNEERYIETAVRNAAGFCDRMLLCDHRSSDGTAGILRGLSAELPSADFHALAEPRESHELLKPLCGSATWIFAVDGDEIYDPTGLGRLRRRIESGEFDRVWTVFGNVLNVTSLAPDGSSAQGHLSPPCRSMTKLYNFAAIESWNGNCPERLHGGQPVFRKGFSATDRRYLHEQVSWDEADFRCLHLCFLPRSTVDSTQMRRNIMETYGSGWRDRLRFAMRRLLSRGRASSRWKQERYRRGPEVTVDASPFFRGGWG